MNDLDPEPSDVTVTAFHEAGHVIIAMKFGGKIVRAETRADGSGECSYEPGVHHHLHHPHISLAGRIAEELVTGDLRPVSDAWLRCVIDHCSRAEEADSEHDDVTTMRLAISYEPDGTPEEWIAQYREWESETIELLSDPELRRRIEIVASGLGSRMEMDGEEVLEELADWEEPEVNPGDAWYP